MRIQILGEVTVGIRNPSLIAFRRPAGDSRTVLPAPLLPSLTMAHSLRGKRDGTQQIEIFRSFEEARKTWLDFQDVAASYAFQHYEWQHHWFRLIGRRSHWDPVITVVHDDAAIPLLLLPLGIRRVAGVNTLSLMGGTVTDYHAPLIRSGFMEAALFQRVWQAILERLPTVDIVEFEKLPPYVCGLPNPLLELGGIPSDASLEAELTGDWESFYQQRVKNRIRVDSDRQRRRLERIGELRFVVAGEQQEFDELLATMVRQKRQRMEEMSAHDFLAQPGYQAFYRELTREWAPQGKVHLSALYCGANIIATHWGIASPERFYFLMPTFAGAEWAKYSPGRLLTENLIRWAFAQGISIFDFTNGKERYKLEWCNRETPLYSYNRILTPKGRAFARAQALKDWVRSRKGLMRRYRALRHRFKLY
jgi:CelD/BcsL family acetyltransferase involved in cellulose biosynthesis